MHVKQRFHHKDILNKYGMNKFKRDIYDSLAKSFNYKKKEK